MKKKEITFTVQNIISSRLQYIKYQQAGLFPDQESSDHNNTSNTSVTASTIQITDDSSAALADALILKFEQYGRTIRSLMLLWNHLRDDNSERVYELLMDNQFLHYPYDELRSMLGKNLSGSVLSPYSLPKNTMSKS